MLFRSDGAFSDYPIWVRSTKWEPKVKYGARKWHFWQYQSDGYVPGIAAKVDRNAFHGSHRDWQAFLNPERVGTQVAKAEPAPVAQTLASAPAAKPAPVAAIAPALALTSESVAAPLPAGLKPAATIPAVKANAYAPLALATGKPVVVPDAEAEPIGD